MNSGWDENVLLFKHPSLPMSQAHFQIQQSSDWTLRAALPSDLESICRIFLNGLNLSLPHRRIADEFYNWERDMASNGKLRKRFSNSLGDEQVRMCLAVSQTTAGDCTVENVLAFVQYNPATEEENGRGELMYLFADPQHHGRGLGSALIKWVKSEARKDPSPPAQRPAKVLVKCFASNVAGVRAYTRAGFVPVFEETEPDIQETMQILEWTDAIAEV
ncbi:hypothetical protein BKA62DRAFT_705422, partial [Auriculariales sp. MPI-PUGE-AT-0066]